VAKDGTPSFVGRPQANIISAKDRTAGFTSAHAKKSS